MFTLGCKPKIDTKNLSSIVKQEAENMAEFLQKKEYKKFVTYTHPKIVEMVGGEQAMIDGLNRTMKESDSLGVSYLGIDFGEPSKILHVDKELQCTISQTVKLNTPQGKFKSTSTMIALSEDNGKHWYFINAPDPNLDKLRKIIPTLSKDLVIQPKQPLQFYN